MLSPKEPCLASLEDLTKGSHLLQLVLKNVLLKFPQTPALQLFLNALVDINT